MIKEAIVEAGLVIVNVFSESILSGSQIGAVAEVEGCIALYKEQYPDVNVIITGGDVNFFEKRLKNSIFADQNLILKGLNTILEYNIKISKG